MDFQNSAIQLTATRILAMSFLFSGMIMIRHTLISIAFTLFAVTAFANEWETAAENGDVPGLTKLIEANLNAAQENGPAMWRAATIHGRTRVLTLLLENSISGCEALLDGGKRSIWHLAMRERQREAVIWLIENKIPGRIDAKNIDPWALAAGYGFFEMLEWLRDNKHPIHLEGVYILRSAISNGRAAVLRWLYDNKIVRFDLMTDELRNFWLFAATFDHTETLDWAESVNLEGIDSRDSEGENIWTLAAGCGNLNALMWFAARDKKGFAQFKEEIRAAAEGNRHFHIIEWLDSLDGDATASINRLILTNMGNMGGSGL
jgi:hypothetical protein